MLQLYNTMTQDFETYLQQARTEFCLVAHRYNVREHNELRTAIDSLLIAYDQAFLALRKHSVMQGLLSDCCQAAITTTEIHYCKECECSCSPAVGQRSGDTVAERRVAVVECCWQCPYHLIFKNRNIHDDGNDEAKWGKHWCNKLDIEIVDADTIPNGCPLPFA